MDIVRQTLSPELLNRIDETILFNRLQREHIDAITSKHFDIFCIPSLHLRFDLFKIHGIRCVI